MLIPFDKLFERWNVNCTGILHCGASYVQERDMYEQLKIPKVIWIEAIESVYDISHSILESYPNQKIINACLGETNGEEVMFHISNNESQSSSYLELGHHSVIHPTVHYIQHIPMETIRLDKLLKWYDIEHLNFGNLDLQGVELSVLKGLGELINQFDFFYLEVNKNHVYEGCALVEEIDDFLKDFQRVETGEWVCDSWTDAFYIRKTLL